MTTSANSREPHQQPVTAVHRVIQWSLDNPLLVSALAVFLAIAGTVALLTTPLDAIPDLTDTQVIVRSDFPGQSATTVEDLVTYPLSATLLGLPKTQDVRGISLFGTSYVYVIFEDGVDLYWARSRVLEALSQSRTQLPEGVEPRLGPDATGVGWVYQYALIDRTGASDLAELRALQDWFLRLELAGVDGVAEVASVGGFVKEYQVLLDPNRLRSFDVSIQRVRDALKAASSEVGGRVLDQGETEYVIRSSGYVDELADLEDVVIRATEGTPVLLRDIARVIEGPAQRRGFMEFDGEGETVAGIVVMRQGENALAVIEGVKRKLKELERGLPAGVEIVTLYDRSPLILGSVRYLTTKLGEEAIAVALVVGLFLLHLRASLVAIITLPLGVLGAFLVMRAQGITANIMSLGGIAIAMGAMVDAAIVLVENASRKLADLPENAVERRRAAIREAAMEVGGGLFFSLLIITVSFLPVFALTGESYRLFSPLAFTKTYAMAFAALLSITLVPVLMRGLLRGRFRAESANPINRALVRGYRWLLSRTLGRPKVVALGALLLLGSALIPLQKLGSEFMPPLYEGELLYMPSTLPGISATKMRELLGQVHRLIKTVPEVDQVVGKAGRADSATDPAPLNMIETWIRLKPEAEWRPGMTVEGIVAQLDARLQIPGLVNSWGYPIKIRMDMVSTGVRTPIGIKVSGDDLSGIDRVARQVETVAQGIPGVRSAFADRIVGGRYLDIQPDRRALARNNIDMGVFQNVIQTALGGMRLAQSVEGRERYDIMLRYDRPFRETADDLSQILVPTPGGAHIPLGELAAVGFSEGPPMVRSENARLNGWVYVDVEGRDLGSVVEDLSAALAESVPLPPGYALTVAGQHEQLAAATARLQLVIPGTIALILLLLILHFRRLNRTLMIMMSLPIGLVGGLWALWLASYHLSVAVAIGFIALAGIAIETAVIMLMYIDAEVARARPTTRAGLITAIEAGAALRLRPKLMTVLTILVGLLPIFLSEGPGADVMRRIALPMLGGMISTLLLTLFIMPALYLLFIRQPAESTAHAASDSST